MWSLMYQGDKKIPREGEGKAVREQNCKPPSPRYLLLPLLPLGLDPGIISGAPQDSTKAESLTSAV